MTNKSCLSFRYSFSSGLYFEQCMFLLQPLPAVAAAFKAHFLHWCYLGPPRRIIWNPTLLTEENMVIIMQYAWLLMIVFFSLIIWMEAGQQLILRRAAVRQESNHHMYVRFLGCCYCIPKSCLFVTVALGFVAKTNPRTPALLHFLLVLLMSENVTPKTASEEEMCVFNCVTPLTLLKHTPRCWFWLPCWFWLLQAINQAVFRTISGGNAFSQKHHHHYWHEPN